MALNPDHAAGVKLIYSIQEHRPISRHPPPAVYHRQYTDGLIIDNGSTNLRAGFSSASAPYVVTENVSAKYKDKKLNKTIMLAGSEAYVDNVSKAAVKSAFEGDIVINFDPMETMLDFVFTQLGVDEGRVNHPVVMTETLCNPHYPRSLMSELLFEGYGIPALTYGVDSLFAFHSTPSAQDGLVISSSGSCTTVIPVLNGRGVLASAKKLPWGGSQSTEFMLKMMQMKYPTFPGRLWPFQAAAIYKDHCYTSIDYKEDLRSFSNASYLASIDRVVRFPFAPIVVEEKTEEELQRNVEKKRETGRRLQEIASKQRMEKLLRQEEEKTVFTELKASKGVGRKVDYEKRLKEAGFSNTEDLDVYLKKIEGSLQRARNKELGVDENEGKEAPTFPLAEVPDHMLNEEDLKEKRRQRLMKAGYDARIRAKAEKEADRLRQEVERLREEEERRSDYAGWLKNLRKEHEIALGKIKERKKRKEQLGDRKSLAAQNRMKSIATLASEAPSGKKRKRGEKAEDEFGRNDADWAVYREIGNADDSDEEEEEQIKLKTVESRLLEFDPAFTIDHTSERLALRKHQLLNAFVRGLAPTDPIDTYDPESVEHNSQLHLNVERIRVPEVIWQPHMAGLDQSGLGEIIEHVLKGFTEQERDRLTSNVFVTGGNTLIPRFDDRLRATLRPFLPPSAPLRIARTVDPEFSTWRGMAAWSRTTECQTALVTKAEYDEYGAAWLKIHRFAGR